MYNPLLKNDPTGMSDQQLEEQILKVSRTLNQARVVGNYSVVMQFQNLLTNYLIEQNERMEIQSFKELYGKDGPIELTVVDSEQEELDSKPKVEERSGGKLSLFRKIMNQQDD